MLTAISRLYLRTVARVGRVGKKQTSKLLKNLLKISKLPGKRKTKLIKLIKPVAEVKPLKRGRVLPQAIATAHAAPAKPEAGSVLALGTWSGIWLSAYYSSSAYDAKLPPRRMSYFLYLPEKRCTNPGQAEKTNTALPLIVMLHGCEQSATQFAQGSRMNQLAQANGYAVLYPQQALRTHVQRCWKWYDQATQDGGGDVGMIVGMIRQILACHPIDQRKVYICGLSAGAAMANIIALNHPDLFAAIGLHSSPMFGAGHSQIGAFGVMQHGAHARTHTAIAEVLEKLPDYPVMPTILIQGMADKIVRPVNQTQLLQQSLMINRLNPESIHPVVTQFAGDVGASTPTHAYEIHDFMLKQTPLLRSIQIADLGHAWSGGDAALAFNSSVGPDASGMLLDFFALHQRSKA